MKESWCVDCSVEWFSALSVSHERYRCTAVFNKTTRNAWIGSGIMSRGKTYFHLYCIAAETAAAAAAKHLHAVVPS